jgi:hypothetical protein
MANKLFTPVKMVKMPETLLFGQCPLTRGVDLAVADLPDQD